MITAGHLRALAFVAQTDTRTATRWLAGIPIRPSSARRLEASRVALGWPKEVVADPAVEVPPVTDNVAWASRGVR